MTLLPWVLFLVLDGTLSAETSFRFATEARCKAKGEELVVKIAEDLQLVNHQVYYQCMKKP